MRKTFIWFRYRSGMWRARLTRMCYAFLLLFTPNRWCRCHRCRRPTANTTTHNNNLLYYFRALRVRESSFFLVPGFIFMPSIKQRKQKAIIIYIARHIWKIGPSGLWYSHIRMNMLYARSHWPAKRMQSNRNRDKIVSAVMEWDETSLTPTIVIPLNTRRSVLCLWSS